MRDRDRPRGADYLSSQVCSGNIDKDLIPASVFPSVEEQPTGSDEEEALLLNMFCTFSAKKLLQSSCGGW